MPMTEPVRTPAPEAVGDIVSGQPPVPITVWYLPAARAGDTMSLALAERLIMNFTHGRRLVIDLTQGEQLARAADAARRRYARHRPVDLDTRTVRASLIVAGWPVDDVPAGPLLSNCAARLMVGGCTAVILDSTDLQINQVLIGAARTAGLTYLQHIVVAHDLTGQRGQLRDDGTHLRVHTDVLIFSRSQLGGTSA